MSLNCSSIAVPPPPNVSYTNFITTDPYKARKTTSTATVLLPLFPSTGGEIMCYAVIVSKMGYSNATFARLKNGDWPHTATWKESKEKGFELPYQAAKFCTDSYPGKYLN